MYEAVGGADGLVSLAGAWHARVMADEVVSHAFSHGYRPDRDVRFRSIASVLGWLVCNFVASHFFDPDFPGFGKVGD